MTSSGSVGTAAAAPAQTKIGGTIVALLALALLADAAVETAASGSPVRWWPAGAAILYMIVTAATWRTSLGWRGRLTIALATFLGAIAATAWLAGGLTDGIHLLGQPTTRVVAALVAAGVAVGSLAIASEHRIPFVARAAFAALATYGVVAFATGAVGRVSLAALLAGGSVWQRVPAVLQGAFVGGLVVLPVALLVSIFRTGLRRPRGASAHAEAWRLTALATSFSVVVAALPYPGSSRAFAGGQAGSVTTESPSASGRPLSSRTELDAALANSLRAVEDGDREAPRDRWDPAYVVGQVGTDPQRLFRWVRGNTFWIPYRGVLRGPAGVLMDRLGNSLDRAMLLGALLRQSHQTVRLAHASLARDRASALLARLLLARVRAARVAHQNGGDVLNAVVRQYQLDDASVRTMLTARADAQDRKRALVQARVPDETRRLTAALGSPPIKGVGDDFERAAALLQDHYWIQVREGDAWKDLDLLSESGAAVVPPSETLDVAALAGDLYHRVTVRVVAEQWSAGTLTEHVALEQAFDPAELIGVPVTLQFAPIRAPTEPPWTNFESSQALHSASLSQHEWAPVLTIGRKPIVQSAVLDTGDLAKPGAEDLVRKSGRDTAAFAKSAADLFNPASKPAAAPQTASSSKFLTAAWIDYEIHAPGTAPQMSRRAVFDLIGPAARAAGQPAPPHVDDAAIVTRSLALMMTTDILPIVCRFAPQFLRHLGAQAVLDNRELLRSIVRGEFADDFAHAQEIARRLTPLPTPLYGIARARFEWSRFADVMYIDRVNLFTRHVFFSESPGGFTLHDAADIVANDVGVDPLAPDPVTVRIEQGVLDTNVEAILRSDRPDPANAGWAFASPGAEWTILASPADPQLAALRLPDDVRRRIADDLGAGFTVVAPKEPVKVENGAFAGWWRVDAASGRTLGMGPTGWGNAMPEWAVTILVIGNAAAAAYLMTYVWCKMSGGGSDAWACAQPASDRRFALLDAIVVPLAASDTRCFWVALEAAFLAGGLGLAGGAGEGFGGGPRGGGEGEPFGGEPPPQIDEPDPALADTQPVDPPPGGGAQSSGGGGQRGGGGGGNPSAGSGKQQTGENADLHDQAVKDTVRRFNEADRNGDEKGMVEATRDLVRLNRGYPQDVKDALGPSQSPLVRAAQSGSSGVNAPGPSKVPPQTGAGSPCPGPGCTPSPMAKSVGGAGGVMDVLNKGGKQ